MTHYPEHVRSLRVGLTGGIGSGKSEVASRLAAQGAVVLDADVIAREVVAPGTPGLAEILDAFGPGILRPDGTLDRDRLGDLVFADEALRSRLNSIVHPSVRERMLELEQAVPPGAICVQVVPLLAENSLADLYDLVVVVDTAPRVQAERLLRDRGLTREQATARMEAQASREQRLAIATMVVDNSGSLAELDREVGELWAELRRRALARRA
jgi:dephospho-CoA kinase